MLTKPPTCGGCPLADVSTGFMRPQVARKEGYGVLLVGEALGEEECRVGAPFVGRAGHRLSRLIEYAGLDRGRFDIVNAVWCRPPDNRLEGTEWEIPASQHCRQAHWESYLHQARVVVPMGNVALGALSGRKGILAARGYVQPGPAGNYLLPTLHPSFIQRGGSKYSSAVILDLQKAVALAREGLPIQPKDYLLDPPPGEAYQWARVYAEGLQRHLHLHMGSVGDNEEGVPRFLAFDIETPGKDEDEGELDTESRDDYYIWRVGFSYRAHGALSVPWTPEYLPAIRLLLGSRGPKVAHNVAFDVPRIRAAGVEIEGTIHDSMIAWHILHSDQPKGLAYVSTFTCPWQPAWKHLSHSRPAFYNATDADVTLQSMEVIVEELKRERLWGVYQEDVVELDPVLSYMTAQGMPQDAEVRYDRAVKLATEQARVGASLEALVPLATRRWTPREGYVRAPEDVGSADLIEIRVEAEVERCERCGHLWHGAAFVGKRTLPRSGTSGRRKADRVENPCYGATKRVGREVVTRWARLDPFKPSREQLIRYNEHLGRRTPTKKDKKTGLRKLTMDEKACKELGRKYPDDQLYQGVLEYRALDKLAGTYIGRPVE